MKIKNLMIVLLLMLSVNLYATQIIDSGKCGDNLTWELTNEGLLTISGTGDMYDYFVSSPWISYCKQIKDVKINVGVTSIGNYAFINCSSLTNITIPNSIISIRENAFRHCSGLTSVTIGNSLTNIGDDAFYGCSSIASITINSNAIISKNYSDIPSLSSIFGTQVAEYILGENIESIGDEAFYDCNALTSINIPNSVTSIGKEAFYGCRGLKGVYISDIEAWCKIDFGSSGANPLYYSEKLYLNNQLITDIIIPKSITTIKQFTFYGCNTLKNIIIPNSVTSIGRGTFSGCSGLTSITIPNSVTSIGGSAFSGCISLTSVSIPNSIISIGESAFFDCVSLTSITIPNSVTSIGGSAFSGCRSLTSVSIPNSIISIKESVFKNCNRLVSITIPNSVTSIGNDAFLNCSGLTSITIPKSVTSIGNAFYGCSSLTSIIWNAKKCDSKTPFRFISSQINTFIIGEEVEFIPEGLCSEMSILSSIIIPNSVTSIGESAFKNCSSLANINIPYCVTAIGASAFNGCSSLKNITIPNNVKDIGKGAFESCVCLMSITIPNSVTNIGESAFKNCSSLTSATIGNGLIEIPDYAFGNDEELEIVLLSNAVKSIGTLAFGGCKRLTDIYCYAERVPDIVSGSYDSFRDVSRKATLWVPANRLRNYQIDTYWSEFDVQPMSAESANTDQVVVTPDYNSADVIWPSESNADTYELIIKDKDGKEICSLIFNSIGQLQSIAFRAPAVDSEHAPQQTQASGFRFTVTGLDSGSQYSYTITAKDAAGKTLQTHTGTFYTLSATGVDNLNQDGGTSAVRKVIEDGQVKIIMPDGRKLNMQGAEVK